MAMEMILTHRNLRDFIVMAHRYLYKAPETNDDGARINSYTALVDKINALLWHDTSEFHEDDMPEDSVQIISNHMKKKLQERFYRQENRYTGATKGWEDPECFAECCMDIWTSFIPGYWDLNSLTNRPRGKQLDQFYIEPHLLHFNSHIAQQLDNIADLMLDFGAYTARVDHLTRVFCDTVSPDASNGLADCLYEIIQSDEDVDESMLDDYIANERNLLEVLHEERDNEFVSDRIYQIANALCQMAITDSMIVNASFKLGEWWTEKQTENSATADEPDITIKETVFDPTTGKVNDVEGTIAAGTPVSKPGTHIIGYVREDSVDKNVIAAISQMGGILAYPDKVRLSKFPLNGVTDSTFRDCEAEAILAKAIRMNCPAASAIGAHVLQKYILQYMKSRAEDGDTDPDQVMAHHVITDAFMSLLPRTMVYVYNAGGSTNAYDMSMCKYICTMMGAYFRKAISTAYVTREIGLINPGYAINPRNIYEDCAMDMLKNLMVIAFDRYEMRELIDHWFNVDGNDPLNMKSGDLFNIFKLCIPTCGETSEVEAPNIPDPHPEMNFPSDPFKKAGADEVAPANYVSYNFVYHLDDRTIDRFALCPTNLTKFLLQFAEMPVQSPLLDDTIFRCLFPHADTFIRGQIRDGYRSICNALRKDAYLGKVSKAEYMWTALSLLIPKWGYPNPHWHPMDDEKQFYDLSMDDINRSASVIIRNILTTFGISDVIRQPSRPMKNIIDFIMREIYPNIQMGTIGNSMRYVSLLIDTVTNVFKANLVRINEERQKLGYGFFNLPAKPMEVIDLSTDMKEFNIPDDVLATAIFYTIVRLCPFDDFAMAKLNSEKTEIPKEEVKPEPEAEPESAPEADPVVTSRTVTSFHYEAGDPSLRTTRIGLANQENQDPHHSAK